MILFSVHVISVQGFPVAQLVKNPPAMRETWVDPWVGKMPWRRERLPTPVFWPGELQGQKHLAGYSHGVEKSQTRLNDFHIHFLSVFV